MLKNLPVMTLGISLVIGCGTGLAADQAPAPQRTPVIVAAEIEQADTEYKTLLAQENKLLGELREKGGATNLPAAIENDAELTAKMKKARELERELQLLKNEIREKMLANPALKDHREKMEKARLALADIQKNKTTLSARRKTLLDEKQALEMHSPEAAAAKNGDAAGKTY